MRATGNPNRRDVLKGGVSALGAMASFSALLSASNRARARPLEGYGGLIPVDDANTGLPLIKLPRGFSYTTFGWRDDPMAGGAPTPGSHDGMAVVGELPGGVLVLIRNHEVRSAGTSFGDPSITYDAKGRGGTTTLLFDGGSGLCLGSRPSLAGTSTNCAGGPTPWGSWISAEETFDGPADGFDEEHGWLFEVPGVQAAPPVPQLVQPVPLLAMGRFKHEAVAVDPVTGFVYETEDDRFTSGLYRFRPTTPLQVHGLADGGILEMLKVVGVTNADLQRVNAGEQFQVEWVQIADPELGPQSGVGPFSGIGGSTTNASGPFVQGHDLGGAQFRRLEGIWTAPDGRIYFNDTEGGFAAADSGEPEGTVWCYDPACETLTVLFASPRETLLDNPDNITVSPRGGILLCEDGDLTGLRLQGLSPSGELFPFAENAVVLNGQKNGFFGDFRGREWAGACFDPSGKWLFANIQGPGITFAITGPWGNGVL